MFEVNDMAATFVGERMGVPAFAGRLTGALLFVATPLSSCSATQAAELEARSIEVGGLKRSYSVYASPACTLETAACAVVLGFHGGGMRGVSGKQLARSGDFVKAAQGRDVILVFPDAVGSNWNDGRPGIGGGIDDVGFVRALIAKIDADFPGADMKRIYATGMSNGGHLSFRLACEMPDRIKAIAPVAATLSVALSKSCKPAGAVSVLNILGEQDPISPYLGGTIKGGRGEVLSADATLAYWQRANRCRAGTVERVDGPVTTRSLDRCAGQVQTKQISLADGGHTWLGHPGAPMLTRLVGNTSMALDATNGIFDFFGIGVPASISRKR
jgi:polyhydroxybutyrate depolymerase